MIAEGMHIGEEEHADFASHPLSMRERHLEAVEQQRRPRQAREPIEQGLMLHQIRAELRGDGMRLHVDHTSDDMNVTDHAPDTANAKKPAERTREREWVKARATSAGSERWPAAGPLAAAGRRGAAEG